MSDANDTTRIDRRRFFKYVGTAAGAAAGAGLISKWVGPVLRPLATNAASAADVPPDMFLAGTDGWIAVGGDQGHGVLADAAIGQFYPDKYAPDTMNTYIFGFRNVSELSVAQRTAQKMEAQHSAPLFWVKQFDPAHPVDFRVSITNLGMQVRPDLFDAHTLHWHGFRNVIPFFDGEPTGSIAVPAGTVFTYVYRPRDPGTYMYHCHVEDVEHVHMGMTGLVFVQPLQNGTPIKHPAVVGRTFTKFAYNDGDGSTGYDREYSMFLSEVWAEAHWADSHIQLPQWSDYRPDFSLLNGRTYPDTILPNAPTGLDAAGLAAWNKPYRPVDHDAGGHLVNGANPWLVHQPLSSLVECNEGERVLLRFANLGFKEPAMTLTGIKMRVVGRDATPMRGRSLVYDPAHPDVRNGADTSYETNTISLGAGESYDAIIEAPPFSGDNNGSGSSGNGYDTYLLYNRDYSRYSTNGGHGGQTTEIHVYPGTTVPPQTIPNS